MRYLFDTNHASAAMERKPALRTRLAASSSDEFLLCWPGTGELWFMVLNSGRRQTNERRLIELMKVCSTVAFDDSAAREFGQIRVELRRTARPIPQIDVQIAAIARVHDMTVLTADAQFHHVQGLKTENWLDP